MEILRRTCCATYINEYHLPLCPRAAEILYPANSRVAKGSKQFHELLDGLKDGKRYQELLQEIGDLHDRKQADYGVEDDPFANIRASTEFDIEPWIGALVRANDKFARLKSFIRNGHLANESVEDSLKDVAVYTLIALVLFEE